MLRELCPLLASLSIFQARLTVATHEDNCEEAYSCQGRTVEDHEDVIDCNGYYSCTEAYLSTINDDIIDCAGSYSCFNAHLDSIGTMVCDGTRSCHSSNITSDGPVNCDGSQSCRSATIKVTSDDTLSCYAETSCAESTIYATDVQVQGIFGAKDALITNYASSLSVEFAAYGAGSGATVSCRGDGTSCSIDCKGNGCDGVTFDCDEGASCSVDCSDSESCNLCPGGFDAAYAWEMIDADSFAVTLNLDEIASECLDQLDDETSDWVCLDADACQNVEHIGPAIGNLPVCCSGNEACENVGLIKNEKVIMCDGKKGCSQSSMEITASSNVLCVGDEACSFGEVLGTTGVPSQRLYCSGYTACMQMNITNIDEVFCTARRACYGATIPALSDGSIYALGAEGLSTAVLGEIEGDVYCLSEGACKKLELETAENVYASGFQSLSEASLSNVNDDVFCVGEESCYKASLSGMEKVYAFGPSALESANIYGRSGGKLFVEIDGDNSNALDLSYGATYIHCNQTSTCVVSCRSTYACLMVTVFCDGDCDYFNCNENDDDYDVSIACPTQVRVGDGNDCKSGSGDDTDGGLIVLILILVILLLVVIFLYFAERNKSKSTQPQVGIMANDANSGGSVQMQPDVETDPKTGKKEFATIDAE